MEVVQSQIQLFYFKPQNFVPENNIHCHNSSQLFITFPAVTENNSLPSFSQKHFTYLSTVLTSPQCVSFSGQTYP